MTSSHVFATLPYHHCVRPICTYIYMPMLKYPAFGFRGSVSTNTALHIHESYVLMWKYIISR